MTQPIDRIQESWEDDAEEHAAALRPWQEEDPHTPAQVAGIAFVIAATVAFVVWVATP